MELKEIRKNSGLKVNKISQVLQISRCHYYALEKGKTKFTNDKIQKLASLFNVDYQYLKEVINSGRDNRDRKGNL